MKDIVFNTSRKVDQFDKNRTLQDVLGTVMEEVGELSTEIGIKSGFKNRKPGKDGIVGEAVDGIIALLDIIYLEKPDITNEELLQLTKNKCHKWYYGKKS